MPESSSQSIQSPSRRDVLKAGALAAGTVLTTAPRVHAAGDDIGQGIKIGLIGCGGRGTGAVLDAVGAARKSIYPDKGYHTEDVAEGAKVRNKGIEVVALADAFPDRLARCKRNLERLEFSIPEERCFVGIDAYQQLLAIPEINYVILATPPHFRPQHFKAAIEAGKNVFMEKPAAVDVPGVQTILEAGQLAKEKGLGVGAGTQRRHEASYRETIARIKDGAIGELLYGKCYWNGGQIWVVNREKDWSDLEWQMRNWNYFTWLGGDHIVEQHVHNLDIMNWVIGAPPVSAKSAIGGRQVRTGERHGHIYDHFAVEYEYPGGVSVFSQCRQINGCKAIVGEEIVGLGGRSNCKDVITPRAGDTWKFPGKSPRGYRLEHEHLISSIRDGKPINEAQALAESTMTGILGREATYSGQEVTWAEAMKSETRLGPESYNVLEIAIPPVAMPGKYKFS